MRMIRYTWRLMAGNKWSFISWLVLAALSSALLALPPVVIGRMIDEAIPSDSTSTVMRYAAAIAMALIISTTLQTLSKLLLDRLANRVVAELRLQLFGWMHRKQLRALNGLGADSLYQRATQSISMLQEKIMLIMRDIFGVTVSALIGLAIIMTIDPWTPVLFLAVFIPYVALRRRIFSRKGYTFYEQAESYGAIVQSVREAVQGIRLIRMSHAEEEELARFSRRQEEHIAIQVRHIHVFSSLLMLNVLMTLVPELIVYGYLGWKVHTGHTTFGSMIVVVGLLGQIRAFVWQVSRYGMMTREFLDHLDRVYELERLPDEPLLAARGETAETKNTPQASLALDIDKRRDEGAAVSFRNVTFSYLSQPVLDRFSLDLPAGTSTGIVGLSGAGKTTLANLLVGLDQPENGVITVDGVPITELDMNGYRQRVCFITQQPYLLNASVRDNVCYGLDRIPDEAVWQALSNTLMADVVLRLENGLDTVIGENGIQLSGGQKQRLAIARAYLANPRVVIMDEATAALDLESEHAVQQSLERLCKGRTSLIIAHRLTTLGEADRIAVIREGRLAELGSHMELMNRKQFYYRLYMEQYKPSEGRRAE